MSPTYDLHRERGSCEHRKVAVRSWRPFLSVVALSFLTSGIILAAPRINAAGILSFANFQDEATTSPQKAFDYLQPTDADGFRRDADSRQRGFPQWQAAVHTAASGTYKSGNIRSGGGPCEYRKYKGVCSITSVRRADAEQQQSGIPYQGYEVRFCFRTGWKLELTYESFVRKEHTLTLRNSWPPGPRFLAKYGIREGMDVECNLSVIAHGTCSPFEFDFPSIDLTDYLEIKPD